MLGWGKGRSGAQKGPGGVGVVGREVRVGDVCLGVCDSEDLSRSFRPWGEVGGRESGGTDG